MWLREKEGYKQLNCETNFPCSFPEQPHSY